MRLRNLFVGGAVFAMALSISGCTHRLIPNEGDKTAKVFMDEDVYKGVIEIEGQLADPKFDAGAKPYLEVVRKLALTKEARDIDGGTRVKIISSDSKGANIEVMEGQYIGYKGFVPKDNVR